MLFRHTAVLITVNPTLLTACLFHFPAVLLTSLKMERGMIFGVINSKGGVGKTTLSVHLTAWLAGKKSQVTLVDADIQNSSSEWARELQLPIRIENLGSSDAILDRIKGLAEEGDHIVIDGPAGLSDVTKSIMLCADRILFPCGPSALDLRAAFDAAQTLREAQEIRAGQPRAIFIPNKVQRNYRLSRELLESAESLGLEQGPPLGLRQAFADAAGQGTTVWKMGTRAKVAANEIQTLCKKVTHV